jgi:hypothetical protein
MSGTFQAPAGYAFSRLPGEGFNQASLRGNFKLRTLES